jgi:hypothetical protein
MSKIETLKATCGAGKREIYIVASPDRFDRWRDVRSIAPNARRKSAKSDGCVACADEGTAFFQDRAA